MEFFTNHFAGQVIGRPTDAVNGVHFYNVSGVASYPSSTSDLRGARMSFYSVDDVIDLTTGAATIAGWKQPIQPGSELLANAVPSADVFSAENPGEWRDAAMSLVDNRRDVTVTSVSLQTDPVQFTVTLSRDGQTKTFAGRTADGVVYSWENMLVDIRGP